MNSEKIMWNSVRQLTILHAEEIIRCKNYFPNVRELIIFDRFPWQSQNLRSDSLNSVIPIGQLTKLVLHSYPDNLFWIIKLLKHTRNLHTLEIDSVSYGTTSLILLRESQAFREASRTNHIRNLIIRPCYIDHIEFLIDLCPRLHQVSLSFGNSQKLLRILFFNGNHRLNDLYLLQITHVFEERMKDLKTFIMQQRRLDQYSLETQYDQLNRYMYLWW